MDLLRFLLLSIGIVISVTSHVVQGLPSYPPSLAGLKENHKRDIARYAKTAEINNFLDTTKQPCRNFYDFTCGNYHRLNPPNKSPYQSNIFQTISASMNRKLINLLKTNDVGDTAVDKKAKKFFESCLKADNLKKNYAGKLKGIISEFGQMPVLEGDKWNEENFDWLSTVAQIAHKYDIRIVVGHLNQVDMKNNTVNRLHVLMQDIPLESSTIYVEDVHATFREARKTVIANTLKTALGVSSKLAKQTAKEIFNFERDLFVGITSYSDDDDEDDEDDIGMETEKASEDGGVLEEEENTTEEPNNDEADDDTSEFFLNLTTVEEMHNNYYPKLDVKRLINISLGYIPTEPVYDLIEDEVDNLDTLMKETPKRIVANYVFYYLIEAFLIPKPKQKNEIETLCIRRTKSHFAKVLDNMAYRKFATNKTEQDVNYMWQTIRDTFKNVLDSDKLSWMKRETRNYALEKLKTIRMEICSYKGENFSEEFGLVHIDNRDYIENLKSLLSARAIKSRAKLKEPPKSYDDYESLSYTPVYIVTENLIKVPVSVLQPYYLWSDYYPNALKFGTLGFLISHELIHGFDNEGRTYDTQGNKHEWWDPESNNYFSNQTECFNRQYSGYIYSGRHLPELSSQSENIADNGGLRLAYDAYLKWYEDAVRSFETMELEILPRLNYTSKQLFFISYGQLWCSSTHPLIKDFLSSTDEHVPEKFRVIGPLHNLEEFSREFQCPVGSPMNPKKRCIIY
ncbi:neprilysin-4-like [Haematobia irritans]|uniref:neprilysin-4-like n=1 Tax=Haematobia irritans TaxID=7368 RepID=UPI003F4FA14F